MDVNWQALSDRRGQWQANVEALQVNNPELAKVVQRHVPANEYFIYDGEHRLLIAAQNGGRTEPLPNPIPLHTAKDIAAKLYPSGCCTEPALIAGLDQGWLWQTVYQLACHTPAMPGHRPPLYFLAREMERFWLVLHLHDWTEMLRDGRVRIFVGSDAVEQYRRSLIRNTQIPWPRLCVTIDQAIWPPNITADSVWQSACQIAEQRMQQLCRQVDAAYSRYDLQTVLARIRGSRLRVLGITSLYTTFLKYSMQDWLEAFESLGHETRLVIEPADHHITNPISFAQAVLDFRPDLIVLIDHYRSELAGLPRQIPCVMWIQDHLPNIFSSRAGAAQGPLDYCLGFGRLELSDKHGYPQRRFMPAQVGVNESRFAPGKLSQSELDAYGCDVSFVSHASTPATALLVEQLNQADRSSKKLLSDIFEQMRAVYDAGGAITQPLLIARMIDSSLMRHGFQIDQQGRRQLLDFFTHRINNALFRHQALLWVAEMDLNLHLYGRGWENHPRLGKYARGVACNQTQLCTIYQASKINLQITPFGAVHQRLLEGLAAGGFFLLRYCPGDVIERVCRQLYQWCQTNGIEDDQQIRRQATPQVQAMLAQIAELMQLDPFQANHKLIDVLKLSADGDYIRSAGTIWPEYDQVAFASAQQLQDRVRLFLSDQPLRQAITQSMRRVVLERFTYRNITQRLLRFIADDLASNIAPAAAVA